jgi:hypothetical protein
MRVCEVLLGAALWAVAVSAELPEYTVLRPAGKIVLDGVLDDEDWVAAPACAPFQFPWWTAGDQEQTEVKLLWDDTFLYVAYACQDQHISADHYNTHSHTFADDCVEMFWSPAPADPQWYNMFEFNCIGNLLSVYTGPGVDTQARSSRILVPHVTQSIRGTVNNDADVDTSWVLEVAVRFSDYKELYDGSTPKDGDLWRVGLNRCGGRVNPQFSQWSPSHTSSPSFHNPADFGVVRFSARTAR